MRAPGIPLALGAVLVLGFTPATPAASPKKIVFVAGPKDHGSVNSGRHEYKRDLTTLKYCLDHSPNVKATTRLYEGQVPADFNEIRDAAVIVLDSSGARYIWDKPPADPETHALFPQDPPNDRGTYDPATLARLGQFDQLMKSGVGLVIFHYTTWVDHPVARQHFLDWIGGYFERGYSKVNKNTWSVALANPSHPILRGVKPWRFDEEEFFANERLPEDPRRTPLLIGTPAKGDASIVSWALVRKGGGRAFVMTGLHWHKNLVMEDYRRELLNGIIWAAKIEVPAGGVISKLPGDFEK